MIRPIAITLFLPVIVCLLLGCGGPDRPATVRVSGKVTFQGAPPPAAGTLFFIPISASTGLPQRPAQADFDTSGAFQVTTFEANDGLIPATYAVKIECWKESTGYEDDIPVSYVPKGFQPPELVVPADQKAIEFNLEVP